MIVSTEGIILHTLNYSDSSKIVTMYSKNFGKIKFLAKGARNNYKKYGTSLQPLSISKATFYKKHEKNLHLLSNCESINSSIKLLNDFEQLSFGLATIEFMKLVFHDEEKNDEIYNLACETILTLSKVKKNFVNIYLHFVVAIYKQLGFEINIEVCNYCKKNIENFNFDVYINITNGNLFCMNCHNKTKQGEVKITTDAFKILLLITKLDIHKIKEININTLTVSEVLKILFRFGEYHLPELKYLKSLKLLENYNKSF